MDILKILEESGKDLYPEDLEFFETELATGGHYNAAYRAQCMSKIRELKAWISQSSEPTDVKKKSASKASNKGIVMGIGDIAPKSANPTAQRLTPLELIESELDAIRKKDSYKSAFKSFIKGNNVIDDNFIDQHYSLFKPWELDAIISVKQMPEDFLEKYFGALDHDKIARYQQFSEAFFMKHFSQMDADIVLKHGKNDWRKKENRSKQLDVFLRLKGVKI